MYTLADTNAVKKFFHRLAYETQWRKLMARAWDTVAAENKDRFPQREEMPVDACQLFMTARNAARYYSAAANLSRIDKREDTDVLNHCAASALPIPPPHEFLFMVQNFILGEKF